MALALLSARLIQAFEGCRLTAYWDEHGRVWTIGFGHAGVRPGMRITQQQADEFFVADCAPLLQMLADKPEIEGAALVSFGYNCGAGALKRLLAGEISILKWGRTSGGVEVPGLVARRELEAALIEASRARG